MGLDMSLTKKTYVKNWDHMGPEERHQVTVTKNGKPVKHIRPERVMYIEEEIVCWRKANQIHAWFVEHVQDGNDNCGEHWCSIEKLRLLLDICEKVLAECELAPGMVQNGAKMNDAGEWEPIIELGKKVKDPAVAEALLPSQGGFFFGSTDYDHWYIQDIEHTAEELRKVIADHDAGIQ